MQSGLGDPIIGRELGVAGAVRRKRGGAKGLERSLQQEELGKGEGQKSWRDRGIHGRRCAIVECLPPCPWGLV